MGHQHHQGQAGVPARQDADQIDHRQAFDRLAPVLDPAHGGGRQGPGLERGRQAQLRHSALQIGLDQGVIGRTYGTGGAGHDPHVRHGPLRRKSGRGGACRRGPRRLCRDHGQPQRRRQGRQQQDQPH